MKRVMFVREDADATRWGSNDDPVKCGLEIGKVYTVAKVDVRSWHTKLHLVEFPNKYFNSVHFREVES